MLQTVSAHVTTPCPETLCLAACPLPEDPLFCTKGPLLLADGSTEKKKEESIILNYKTCSCDYAQ